MKPSDSALATRYIVCNGSHDKTPRDRMSDRILRPLLHFLAGAGIAAYLLPEGAGVVAASVLVVVAAKAVYDYVAGGIRFSHSLALAAGGLVGALLTGLLT